MKKNEHYFPTVEWIKDPSESCGWRRITKNGGKEANDEGYDGINGVAEEPLERNESED